AAQTQAALKTQRDFGLHVGKFLLDQLVGSQGATKLLAVERVLAGGVPAVLCGAQGTPGDTVAGRVQAGERAAQTGDAGHHGVGWHFDFVHHDFAGDGGPQADLAVDGRGAETLEAFFKDEAADLAVVFAAHHFCPDNEYVGDRRVGNLHLVAGELVATVDLDRAGFHAARVRAVVGFRQAKAAYPFASSQLGQVFLFLLFGAELVDGNHDQRRLHAHHRAVAGVDTLDFAGDQAIAYVIEARATVSFGNGRPKQPELTHFRENGRIGFFVAESFEHARCELVLSVGTGSFTHHALVFG